jgi:glycosyltransferase involved in cell wall biosynthesis
MSSVVPQDPSTRRMRVLIAVSSTNQLYSGIGRLIFETCSRMADRFAFEFAIDDLIDKNVNVLVEFGKRFDMPVHVGRARVTPEALDVHNEDLPRLMRDRRWDAVETHSWANGATNGDVLKHIGDRPLGFTSHYQPKWTVGMTPRRAEVIDDTHRRMVRRADVVFCVSPWEVGELQSTLAPHQDNCVFTPHGCDLDIFRPGPVERKPQLVFVGDQVEPRKRFDRVLDLYQRLVRHHARLRLVVVGNRSEEVLHRVPEHLRSRVETRGYVTDPELAAIYAESMALVLLSEYEAFGIPILEALACGTPVLLSRIPATRSVFLGLKGTYFCPEDDPMATAEIADRVIRQQPLTIQRALSDRSRIESEFCWHRIADVRATQLRAAWFRRKYWAISA